MLQRYIALIFAAAALLGVGVFVVWPDSYRDFLRHSGALVSETFGDIFGGTISKEPVARISLDGEQVDAGGEPKRLSPSNAKILESVPSKTVPPVPTPLAKSVSTKVMSTQEKESEKAPNNDVAETKNKIPECVFSSSGVPNHGVVLNEIAWMGSSPQGGESGTAAAANEWIELRNVSVSKVVLAGSQILDESENFRIELDGELLPGSLYLLERTDDNSVPAIAGDLIYAGAMPNSGMWLRLFDAQCALIDEVDARSGWLAGNNSTKQTMERKTDLNWQASAATGGTPKAANSIGQSINSTITSAPPTYRTATVSMQGDGAGKVTSNPAGINCGFDCIEDFPSGAQITFVATPEPNSSFEGWSGACAGKNACEITVSSPISIVATFKSTAPPQSAPPPQLTSTPTVTVRVLFSEVMAGSDASSDDEFIELYNPTSSTIDLSGWTIKKRTSTGSESTLVAASRLDGKNIPPGKHFLLAREGGYAGVVSPDVFWPTSSSYALAYSNNAVMLFDASGNKIEEIVWTEILKNQSYERQPLTESGQFGAQSAPNPQNSGQ